MNFIRLLIGVPVIWLGLQGVWIAYKGWEWGKPAFPGLLLWGSIGLVIAWVGWRIARIPKADWRDVLLILVVLLLVLVSSVRLLT